MGLIHVGVSIGTGVFFESGYALSLEGLACLVLAYLWTGSVLYGIMVKM